MKVELKRGLTVAGVFLVSVLLGGIMKGFFPGSSHFEGIIIQGVFAFLFAVCFMSIIMSIITLSSFEKRISKLEAKIEALKKKSM